MFAFPTRGPAPAIMEGGRVHLRHPEAGDYEEWTRLRGQSASFLQPWEPAWSRDELTRPAYRARLRRYQAEIRAGTGHPFFICRNDGGTLVGGITLGNIRRGVAQCAQIGYWIGERHAGQGYMGDAVTLVSEFAFSRLGLHRLEAACIPDNERSIRLLEKHQFEREGTLRGYLKINGRWRDHVLYSQINPLHAGPGGS